MLISCNTHYKHTQSPLLLQLQAWLTYQLTPSSELWSNWFAGLYIVINVDVEYQWAGNILVNYDYTCLQSPVPREIGPVWAPSYPKAHADMPLTICKICDLQSMRFSNFQLFRSRLERNLWHLPHDSPIVHIVKLTTLGACIRFDFPVLLISLINCHVFLSLSLLAGKHKKTKTGITLLNWSRRGSKVGVWYDR